jgi:hypothetical protein
LCVSSALEDAAAKGRTDVVHYPIQQTAIGNAVIDESSQSVVTKISVEAPVKRPIGVDVLGELRAQELPGQFVELRTAAGGN